MPVTAINFVQPAGAYCTVIERRRDGGLN